MRKLGRPSMLPTTITVIAMLSMLTRHRQAPRRMGSWGLSTRRRCGLGGRRASMAASPDIRPPRNECWQLPDYAPSPWCVCVCVSGWANERMDGLKCGRLEGYIYFWPDGWVGGLKMSGWLDRWLGECVGPCMGGCKCGQINAGLLAAGWLANWLAGWLRLWRWLWLARASLG